MGFELKKIKFISIDQEYLKVLHDQDPEVFYRDTAAYKNKPYMGILVHNNNYQYAIPLTSAKIKHLGWGWKTDTNFIIYEDIKANDLHENDLYKPLQNDQVRKLLSVLELKKMIPVKEGLYEYIDFKELSTGRKNLLEKEYLFCANIKSRILEYASKMYEKQIESGLIIPFQCDFKKLEEICNTYSIDKNTSFDISENPDKVFPAHISQSFLNSLGNDTTFENEAASTIEFE